MKKIHIILFLIPFISYCQTDHEFKLQNVSKLGGENYCISKMDYFSRSIDTNDFMLTLYYSNKKYGNKECIETMDWSNLQYGSTLNCFKSEKNNSYIVLWKIDGEYSPLLYAYYIKDGKLIKIGEWGVSEPCVTCNALDYSIKDIRIYQRNDEIEFLFLKDTKFVVFKDLSKNLEHDDWGVFKAGKLIVSFNLSDRILILKSN
jgi:hypothetical protein